MFEQVFSNLFVFYSANQSANSYLLIGKKTVLIDSGLKINEQPLKNSLAAVGLQPEEINTLCHTHGHADHFGADGVFPKAEIMMHKSDADYVNIKDEIATASANFGSDYYPKIRSFLKDGVVIDAKPFLLHAIETPGHSPGSVCFHEPNAKLLFSGDTLFAEGFGRYDLPKSSKAQLLESLRKIAKLDFTLLLPGHGKISKTPKPNLEAAIRELEG